MNEVASDRIDRWLWHARFFKTRTLASEMVAKGKVRINGRRTIKPAATVRVDDVLTFAQAKRIRLIRVTGIGERRGPASEAGLLYDDLDDSEHG